MARRFRLRIAVTRAGPSGRTVSPTDRITDYGGSPEAQKSAELFAVGFDGLHTRFPIAIDGLVSRPAFDGVGRFSVTANDGPDRRARTLVFDAGGRPVDGGSDELADQCDR